LRMANNLKRKDPITCEATGENHQRLLCIAEAVTGIGPEMIINQDRKVEIVAVRAICVHLWLTTAKESDVNAAAKFKRDRTSCYNLQKRLNDGQYTPLKGFPDAQRLIIGYWQDFLDTGVMPAVLHQSKISIR